MKIKTIFLEIIILISTFLIGSPIKDNANYLYIICMIGGFIYILLNKIKNKEYKIITNCSVTIDVKQK